MRLGLTADGASEPSGLMHLDLLRKQDVEGGGGSVRLLPPVVRAEGCMLVDSGV